MKETRTAFSRQSIPIKHETTARMHRVPMHKSQRLIASMRHIAALLLRPIRRQTRRDKATVSDTRRTIRNRKWWSCDLFGRTGPGNSCPMCKFKSRAGSVRQSSWKNSAPLCRAMKMQPVVGGSRLLDQVIIITTIVDQL